MNTHVEDAYETHIEDAYEPHFEDAYKTHTTDVLLFVALGIQPQGNCSSTDPLQLCWQSTPIASATATTVTLTKLPAQPRAIRYLWYIAPQPANQPGKAPVYAKGAEPMPAGAAPLPSTFDDSLLPLGPFVMKL
jgi:hypothetical protein